jgi:hypothetical protein
VLQKSRHVATALPARPTVCRPLPELDSAGAADRRVVCLGGSPPASAALQLGTVGFERSAGPAQCEGEAADLGVPHSLLPAQVSALPSAGEAGQDRLGERCAGELAVEVVAAEQKCADSDDLVQVVASCWRALSRMRSASRSPSARGMGNRSVSSYSAVRTARLASIASDLP